MTCVVDEDVDICAAATEFSIYFVRRVRVLEIFRNHLDRDVVLRSDLSRHIFQFREYRCDEHKGMRMFRKLMREMKSDAARRTSDYCSFHICPLLNFRPGVARSGHSGLPGNNRVPGT